MNARQKYEVSRDMWRGIDLEIRHCRQWCAITGLDHIEVRSRDRVSLPITETGYRSHFIAPEQIAEFGTAAEYVLAWIDRASQSQKWKQKDADTRQLPLF
jgi:hypothetical protein